MSISPLDSPLYRGLLADDAVLGLLDEAAEIAAMLQVEAALAEAEGTAGAIPKRAAAKIARVARSLSVDPAKLAPATARDGVPVPALVAALRAAVGGTAASFVHWGATSQDIADTALLLRLRALLTLCRERIDVLGDLLADLAAQHRNQVMLGRTRGQQATPITFGLKAAGWLSPLARQRDRLQELAPRLFRLSLGGAAGTLSALGQQAPAVEEALAARLNLRIAAGPWHSQRDRLLELGGWFSMLTAALGKIGKDLALLAQNEVAEVRLPGGGSSTMPNKQNPISAEALVVLAQFNAAQLGLLHSAALQEQERGGVGWTLEWLTLPSMAAAAAGAEAQAIACLEGLVVRGARMEANLEAALGLPFAERIGFALSAHMPRAEAQALVKKACAEASAQQRDLFDLLPGLTAVPLDWEALRRPDDAVGCAELFIDRTLAEWRAR